MGLSDYATDDFYSGLDLKSNSFVSGKEPQLWLKSMPYGASAPGIINITLNGSTSALAVDDETVNLTADADVTLYKGDVIKFPTTGFIIVLSDDTTLTASNAADVPILPALAAVSADETGKTYGLLPFLSVQDGGGLENSSNVAEARNKVQGVWGARLTFSRSASTSTSGKLITTDPALAVLNDVTKGTQNIYMEQRYPPYVTFTINGVTYTEGTGPGAYACEMTVNTSQDNPGDDFVGISGTFEVSGRPRDYVVLV